MRVGKDKRYFHKDGVLRFTATLKDGTCHLDMAEMTARAVADPKFDNKVDLWHFRLG